MLPQHLPLRSSSSDSSKSAGKVTGGVGEWGSVGEGGILEKFDPCARPCAVLVQCLERLVHLGFAMGALCGEPDFRNYQTNTALSSRFPTS